MISILDKERKRIEGKLVAETFENVISNEKLVYDFSKKTEIIEIEFKSKNYISKDTHIIIKDESKNDSEFICIKEDGLKSSLIPAYVNDLNNKFMSSNKELKGQLKSVIQTILMDTGYGVEFNDLIIDEEITLPKSEKSIFEKLLDIFYDKDFSIRHKYDIETGERTLIINKGKDLRKSNPKEVSGRIPGFEFNLDKSNIKTGLIMYNDNNESITVKDTLNQTRFIKDENYIFGTMEVKGKTREEMEAIASKYLNDSSLNAIDLKMTGLILRNWTNCHYNKFISSQIFINYKNVKPDLTAGFQIYKLERSLFDYNIEKFNFFAKYKSSNEIYKPEILENYTKYANDNIFIKDNSNSSNNDLKLVESLVNKQLDSFKNYISEIGSGAGSIDGSSNLKSNKELNFDAIISDFNLIKSQKDQVNNQLKSIFGSAYLKEDSIKIQVRDKIKEIDNNFNKIKSEVNKLNRADQDESLMKDINKLFIGFYSIINSTKTIVELSNEAINLEMNKLQNEYSHGIKDTIFSEIGRVLGLTYDSKTKTLTGDINVAQDINEVKTSLELMRNKVNRIEQDLENSDRGLKDTLMELKENLSSVLGLPLNSESGLIDGTIDKQDLFDLIQEQIQKTKDEINESKLKLADTKVELEKQQEELYQKSLDIDGAMAEANRIREDLTAELETSQQEFNYYMDSRGDNLVFNGNADQGDNSNFPEMYYDNSDAFQSAASFRMDGFNVTSTSERLIPINPEKTYKLSMFMKNNNSLPSSIGHLSYDKDGQLIESQHVMGSEKPVIELAQELRQGDRVIYFKSLDGLDDTYRFQSPPIEDEDYTPNYDYDRDGSVVLPTDADDILTIDDLNALPDEEEERVIYAEDTPEEDRIDEGDIPIDEETPVETNSTPLNDEADATMSNDYNTSNAGIVNRNINPNLKDYNDNHSLVIWNYKSNDGYDYGVSTYSRNVFLNGWDYSAIDRENNCIYLNRPFDMINYDSEDGGFPAGTKVSGTFTDSNVEWSVIKDEVIPNLAEDDDPEEFNGWYHRQGLITKENVRGTNGFLYGSFYMSLFFKANITEDSDVTEFNDGSDEPKFWVTNLEMYDVTGLESVKKTVIDTNELVATMMTKKEMDDYRKQVIQGFSEVSQTVDMIRQEVSKKIEDLDDKMVRDISSKLEVVAGEIRALSEEQKVTNDSVTNLVGSLKVATDNITALVSRIERTEQEYSELSTKVTQLDDSYKITAEKVTKNEGHLTDLTGELEVTNEKITQEVTNRQTAIDDTIQSLQASITTTADSIKQDISKDYATKTSVSDTISSLNTSITAEIGRIDQRVTSETSTEAISGKVKIGTKNIVAGTEKFDLPFLASITKKVNNGITYANTRTNMAEVSQIIAVKPNTNYVLSYDAYSAAASPVIKTPITRASSLTTEVSPKDYLITMTESAKTLTTTPTRYELRFNSRTNNFIKIQFTADNSTKDTYVGHIQVEEGNVASSWDVSPEDYRSRFAKNETRITQTENNITLNAQSITQLDTKTTNQYSELKVETDKITSIVSKQEEMDGKISANRSSIEQLPGQITAQVSAVETRVNENINNIKIGGRNLFQRYNDKYPTAINKDITSTGSFTGKYWAANLYSADFLKDVLQEGETYTFSYELEILENNPTLKTYSNSHGISFYSTTLTADRVYTHTDIEPTVGNKMKVSKTFVAPKITDHRFIAYSGLYSQDGTSNEPRTSNTIKITNLMLEKGNKATDWNPAPEDINGWINDINIGTRNLLENSLSYNKGLEDNSNPTYTQLWYIDVGSISKKVKEGDTITISFDLQMQRGDTFSLYDSVKHGNLTIGRKDVTNIGKDKFRFSYTTKLTSITANNSDWVIYAYNSNNGDKFTIENIKIEKGNKATDWTPAPEDVEGKINNIKVGSRNLALNTRNRKDTVGKSQYKRIEYTLTKPLEVGKEYTAIFKYEILSGDNGGKLGTMPYSPDGTYLDINALPNTDIVYTFKANAASSKFLVYPAPRLTTINDTTTINIKEFTLVEGNINSGYSQAPEDVEQSIIDVNSKIDLLPGKISLAVEQTETKLQNNIDSIQVGGRNLLLKSNTFVEGTSYALNDYYTSYEIPEGTLVTLSLKATLGSDRKFFGIYNSGGMVSTASIFPSDMDSNGVFKKTFRWVKVRQDTGTIASNKFIRVYHMDSSATSKSSIEWMKLEIGNKATDWSPAPEDVDGKISNINVGGRNLLEDSNAMTPYYWRFTESTASTNNINHNVLNGELPITNKNNTWKQWQVYSQGKYSDKLQVNLNPSKMAFDVDYTLSVDIKKVELESTGKAQMMLRIERSSGGTLNKPTRDIDLDSDLTYDWKRFSVTDFISKSDLTNATMVRVIVSYVAGTKPANGSITFKDVKLETGNKATAWSPSPEDVDASITKTNSRIDLLPDSILLESRKITNEEVDKVILKNPNLALRTRSRTDKNKIEVVNGLTFSTPITSSSNWDFWGYDKTAYDIAKSSYQMYLDSLDDEVTGYAENLLVGTTMSKTPEVYGSPTITVSTDEYDDRYADVTKTGTSSTGIVFSRTAPNSTSLSANTKYRLSFEYSTTDVKGFNYLYIMTEGSASNISITSTVSIEQGSPTVLSSSIDGDTKEWNTWTGTFTPTTDVDSCSIMIGHTNANGSRFLIKNVMLTEGEAIYPWAPNSLDLIEEAGEEQDGSGGLYFDEEGNYKPIPKQPVIEYYSDNGDYALIDTNQIPINTSNMLLNTRFQSNDSTGWRAWIPDAGTREVRAISDKTLGFKYGLYFKTTVEKKQHGWAQDNIETIPGKMYTASCYVYFMTGSKGNFAIQEGYSSATGGWVAKDFRVTTDMIGKWMRLSWSFMARNEITNVYFGQNGTSGSGELISGIMTGFQLEQGSVLSEYTSGVSDGYFGVISAPNSFAIKKDEELQIDFDYRGTGTVGLQESFIVNGANLSDTSTSYRTYLNDLRTDLNKLRYDNEWRTYSFKIKPTFTATNGRIVLASDQRMNDNATGLSGIRNVKVYNKKIANQNITGTNFLFEKKLSVGTSYKLNATLNKVNEASPITDVTIVFNDRSTNNFEEFTLKPSFSSGKATLDYTFVPKKGGLDEVIILHGTKAQQDTSNLMEISELSLIEGTSLPNPYKWYPNTRDTTESFKEIVSQINLTPESISINADRINLGDGDLIVEDNIVKVKSLSLNHLRGGTATFGGTDYIEDPNSWESITNPDGTVDQVNKKIAYKYPDGVIKMLDSTNKDQTSVEIKSKGASWFKELTVDKLNVSNINGEINNYVKENAKTITYYVIGSSGSDSAAGTSKATGLETIQEAIDRLPKYIPNGRNCYIRVYKSYNKDESRVGIFGFTGGGSLIIELWEKASINSRFYLRGNSCYIAFVGTDGRAYNRITEPDEDYPYIFYISGCSYVYINKISLGNIGTRSSNAIVASEGSSVRIRDMVVYNSYIPFKTSLMGEMYSGGLVYGKSRNYSYSAESGSIIHLYGECAGTYGGVSETRAAHGSSVMKDSGVTFNSDKVVTTPPAPVAKTVTSYVTKSFSASSAAHYVTSGFWSQWNPGYVMGGRWGTMPGEMGIWIFPSTMKSTLKGKDITKVQISITRVNGIGLWAQEISGQLRMHKHASKPSKPSFSNEYYTFKLSGGKTKTFDITSKFKSLLKSGSYAGFGVKSPYTQNYYAAYSKTCKVTVTYKVTKTVYV
ncbi:hypothetical protein [Staphylococcus phage vB_StaM_SA1]|nr:hypothetical protein [Staphylococcus phage vB_StaM_SA1]